MAKRNNDDEYGVSQDDPFSWLSCIVALGLGIAMIAIESTKGQNCKIRDVDSFAWNDPEAKGQIPIVRFLVFETTPVARHFRIYTQFTYS